MNKSAFSILRDVTVAVKIAPFIIVFLYIICNVAYMFTDDNTQTILDTLFYASPVCIGLLLVLSHILKMCVWHKIECVLPLFPQIVLLVDMFSPLDEMASTVNVIVDVIIFLSSIINAYYVFTKYKCYD